MHSLATKTAGRFTRSFGMAHACTDGLGLNRRHRKFVPVLLAVLLLPTLLVADERAAASAPSPKLNPINRSELENAVAAGTVISHRAIQGPDIAAVLLGQAGSAQSCGNRSALRIDSSSIDGEILIERKTPEKVESEEEPTSDEPKQQVYSWISIPISIRASAIHGKVTFSRVGLGCTLDLRDSKFDESFNLIHVVVVGDANVDDTVYKKDVEVLYSLWKGSVFARRTQFMGNAEFTQGASSGFAGFLGDTDFQEAVFQRFANFMGTRFEGHTNFRYTQFKGEANFGNTAIGSGPRRKLFGPFYMTEFSGRSIFRNSHFKGLTFFKTIFRDGVEFDNTHGTTLHLMRVALGGRADFSDARIDHLEFTGWIAADGEAVFRRAQLDELTFSRVDFRKDVDFEGARFCSQIVFRNVSFEGDLHFEDAVFPGTNHACNPNPDASNKTAFLIVDTTLNKGLYADADQLLSPPNWWAFWKERSPSFTSGKPLEEDDELTPDERASAFNSAAAKERRLWRELERAFRAAGELELENYATYRLRYLEEPEQSGLTRLSSIVSRWFWGYGLRPMRLAMWLALLVLTFASVYWTQLAALAAAEPRLLRHWLRAKYALVFSVRTTWQVTYGYERSRTTTFRVVTLLQSAAGKVLLTCFAYSLSHTSPLLNELMKKLLP